MAPWWSGDGVLRRYVVDLLADEMARHRRAAIRPAALWSDHLRLDEDLGADSLELITLATALAEALHLHASGIEDYLLVRRTLGDWVAIAQAGLRRHDTQLTFRTSGSTGVPKPCVHDLASLLQETRHLATLVPGRRRILCAVPSHHIYGFLFSVLLPQALGIPDNVLDLRASTPAWLARGAQAGDLVIGFPDFWQAVARTVPKLPAGVIGVTSCAPCPDVVAQAIEAAGATLLHVYGSSETGGIGAREAWNRPYTLFPHWSVRGDREVVRRLPDASSQVHALQDSLQMVDELHFRVGARRDGAVQVGGINVFPTRVRDVLKRHPAVQDAAVRLMRPEEGARLKAFIVTRPDWGGPTDALSALHAWIEQELAAPERPRAIRFGDELPRTPAGKQADWDLHG